MKKHLNYWLALVLLLPALGACHDDDAMPGDRPGTAGTPTVVSASIGNEPDTRAQVQWGTQNADDGELFMWNTGDKFKAYDITTARASTFTINSTYDEANPSGEADFSSQDFSTTAGDKIAAFYGAASSVVSTSDPNSGKEGIRAVIEPVGFLSQQQTSDPGNADLKHLQSALYMYAIGEAGENNTISRLSFRHLSALFRFTIRNQQGTDAKVQKAGISFNGQKIICQKKQVTLWDDHTMTYTVDETDKQDAAELSLEGVNGINAYATIASGNSYDCFLTAMPVAEERNTASSLKITVTFEDGTSKSLDIAGFNGVEIKAGMRYWFDLTVKADGTLVQTFKTDYTWYASNKDAAAFSISTPGELSALARLVNGDAEALTAAGVSGPVSFQGKTINLAGNIDLGNEGWTPIGNAGDKPFSGTFDGGGRHISGLSVNKDSDAGLFGIVLGGTVRNLRVSGTVTTTGTNAGGIVGNLFYDGIVENCTFSGTVSGNSGIGGIAGNNTGNQITGCYTKGAVIATNNNAGGIVGNNNSQIDRCYSEATVTVPSHTGGIAGNTMNGKITNSYATGAIRAGQTAGGIAGNGFSATVTGCIALNPSLTRTEGNASSFGRIVGSEMATLTDCAAFAGITLPNGVTATSAADGIHGADLTREQCLTATTYTSRGFTGATGWAFDPTAPTWKAFETFPGITEADYRIRVPAHLGGNGGAN